MNWKLLVKITTGFLVVPICIVAHLSWPLWTKSPLPMRILTAPIVLPLVGVAILAGPWWDKA